MVQVVIKQDGGSGEGDTGPGSATNQLRGPEGDRVALFIDCFANQNVNSTGAVIGPHLLS